MTRDTKAIAIVAEQIGSTLLPDNEQWTNRFQVKSQSSSSLYTIAQRRTDHSWGCSCPGWRNHRRCKHLTDVLRRLAGVAASAAARAYDAATIKMLASARLAYLELEPIKDAKAPVYKSRKLELE